MIILLGLVVVALVGAVVMIAGLGDRKPDVIALGLALVLLAVGTALVIRASCDAGCEIGSGAAVTHSGGRAL